MAMSGGKVVTRRWVSGSGEGHFRVRKPMLEATWRGK